MPLIRVQTSQPEPPDVNNLLQTLSAKLAQHLRKPESYVMTSFQGNVPMTFGGTFDPACFIEVKSIGQMSSRQTQEMSQDFCEVIAFNLDVPPNRIYIDFADAEGYLWGWNSSTF